MIAVSILVAILLLGLAWVALIPVCAIQRLSQPTILGTAFLIALAAQFLPACVFLFDPTMGCPSQTPRIWVQGSEFGALR